MRSPKLSIGIVAASLGLLVTAWEGRPVKADISVEQTTVLARIGDRTITLADYNRRVASIPPFQLKGFGRNAAEIKKNFLERVLVREVLLSQGAADAKMTEREDVKERTRSVLRNAALAKARADTIVRGPVSQEDIKAYYEKNWSKFNSPARVWIWRIQVAKREEAVEIIAAMKKDPTTKRWNEAARDRSLDKATAMRGGNVGFVAPDGTTAEPGLKIDKAVLAAVAGAKDQELLQEPVKAGDRWEVVWKRQTSPAVSRSLDVEAMSIRQVLTHERASAASRELIERLRGEHMRDFHPELLDQLEVGSSGEVQQQRRPGTLPVAKKTLATPTPGPGGR